MRVSTLLPTLGQVFLPGRRRRWKFTACSLASSEILEMRQLLTAQITQMSDLNLVAETGSSDPRELTQVGNTLFFTATDKTHGRELWKKEGTNAAVLVKDIFVGTDSSVPVELTAVGTTLFFSANNGINGRELWKSDGTPAGTMLVKDIWGLPGDSSSQSYDSNPHLLTSAGGKLFYVAHIINENISGIVHSLVVSDGTAAGTGIVNSSIGDMWTSSDARLTAVGSEVYFRASSPGNVAGTELWKSDGTTAGTVQISDIWPGGGVSHVEDITPVGGTTYFTAWYYNGSNGSHNRELWKTDGTSAGTVLLKDINTTSVDSSSDPLNLTNMNGTLYFTADDGVNGRELWKSNGTAAGTTMVKEIVVGPSGTALGNLMAIGSTLYFSASDGVTGDELWRSDGTAAGTVRVGHSGTSANFTPRNLTNIGGSLYFSAFTFETGFEVWKSDGTTEGTNVYKDLVTGAGSSGPTQLLNLNGVLYYTANDGMKGNELWRHDVTTNTSTVNDIFRGTLNSSARHFTAVGSDVFFIANNGINGEELWKCAVNGTGATMVKDIHPGVNGGEISQLTNVNGVLYFSARNDDSGFEVWKSDGTNAGTVVLKEIGAAGASSYPSALTNLNGTLIFSAQDANGHELWKSDGTAAGTVMVKNIATGATGSIDRLNNSFVVIGSTVFFTADDGVTGAELWKTDGTAAGTVLVKDIRTGTTGSSPRKLTDVAGLLYFIADNGTNGTELWQSTASAAGTIMVADLNVSNIDQLTNVAGKLFFTANGELWSRNTSASTPTLLREIGEGNWEGDPLSLTAVGSTLYFTAVFATQSPRVGWGRELWKSDGTTAGTVLVKDIVNLPVAGHTSSVWGSNPLNLVNNNGTLYFTANDMAEGQELWKSDGTATGTRLVADVTEDPGSSHPENLTVINNLVYMTAVTESTGREVFAVMDSLEGTVGSDVFVLSYGSTNTSGTATLTLSSNGGPIRNLGAFPMSVPLQIDGLGGTDTFIIRGTPLNDIITADYRGISVNGSLLTLASIESRVLNGGTGNDTYRFDADGPRGTFTLDESVGGHDTIDLSSTTLLSVALNLSNAATQIVNANLALSLLSGGTFENVTGGSRDDILIGNALSNSITGGPGSDQLRGSAGDDLYLFGTANSLEADVVTEYAGQGTDTLSFSTLTNGVTISLGSATDQTIHSGRILRLSSTSNFENAVGGSGDDHLTGNALANLLTGHVGHDTLTGAGGNDTLLGGLGNDTYVFGNTTTSESDLVTEAAGQGIDTLSFTSLSTSVTVNLATTLRQSVHTNRTLTLNSPTAFENVSGGRASDVLLGNSVSNVLVGDSGHDLLVGNSGDDVLRGGEGRDLLIGGLGADTLDGGLEDDILIAGRTSHDAAVSNLLQLQAEWISSRSYSNRIANLRSGVGSPVVSLRAKVSVRNDTGEDDTTTGGPGSDWFLKATDDIITDLLSTELTDIL